MNNRNTLLAVFSVLCLQTFAQVPDVIKIAGIPRPLTWATKGVSYQENSANSVTIGSDKKTDMYVFVDGQYYNNSGAKLVFAPDSDFIFTTKVKPAFDKMYDGGGVLLYTDSSNWASLLFENIIKRGWTVSSLVVNNLTSDGNYYPAISNPEVFMKIVKSGKIFCFYYSSDGKVWNIVRTFPYERSASLKIGFFSQSPEGPGCKVEFSEISYRPKKFSDFEQGE
jgi:uncharacterized protein